MATDLTMVVTESPKVALPKENKDANFLTSSAKGVDITTAEPVSTMKSSTKKLTQTPSSTKSSTILTSTSVRRVKVTTVPPVVIVPQSTAKHSNRSVPVPNPTYRILVPDSSTGNPGVGEASGGGTNKAAIIGGVVGALVGIALVAAIILVILILRRRKQRHQRKDIMQVENPRYQPISDRKRGEFRFSESEKKGGIFRPITPSKSKNNNRDSDIEVLATRSSSRKKRQAPPPPNPFGNDDDFTADRRASRDPDLSPGPVELSTFASTARTIDEDTEPSADKPLLNKENTDSKPANGSITRTEDAEDQKPLAEEAGSEDEDDIDKLVQEHKAKSQLPKAPDDYHKTKNPFAD